MLDLSDRALLHFTVIGSFINYTAFLATVKLSICAYQYV